MIEYCLRDGTSDDESIGWARRQLAESLLGRVVLLHDNRSSLFLL
jgi:hypothetical protein